MNTEKKSEAAASDLPRAKIKKQSRFSIIWVVPVIAAIAAGWLVYQNVRQTGPTITLQFNDGTGVQANQTVLKYRGVRVGEVNSVHLTKGGEHVEVKAQLDASAKSLARAGSLFWIVRPEVGAGGLHGLETVVSGPYIQVQMGSGKEEKNFVGVEEPPIPANTEGGLEVVVTTPHLPTLSEGSPVYYRGVEVGSVRYFALADDAETVKIHLLIETNFAPLVRTDSKFWNAGGVKVDLRFFKIDVNAQTFKSLVIGGIAFATPTQPGPAATSDTTFELYEKMDDKWQGWSPSIPINTKTKGAGDGSQSVLLNNIDSMQK